ncbi:MAG: hypothetical protein EYC70_13620 [Planctomycetota bacterium]|nr:MAG: hypothetical protein EYC70_13620 [Planctomycetota bacterium]
MLQRLPEHLYLSLASTTLALLALSWGGLQAQTCGGESDILFRFDGQSASDYFGVSVAGAGDVNADGVADIVIGAEGTDVGTALGAGSAFVYSGATRSLLHRFDGLGPYYLLGCSVASAGDVDGDGADDIIVGAKGVLAGDGSAFVYSGATGALLHRFDGYHGSSLGVSVSGAGDVNGDGFDDLIVGADHADVGGHWSAGSAFLYSGATGALLLRIDGEETDDELGHSVSGAGDVDGDGLDDVIVGAAHTDPGGVTWAGSAFVYSGGTGALLYRLDGNVASGLLFGESVSGAGDVNGDGYDDVVVGARFTPGVLPQVGAAFIYSGVSGALLYRLDGSDPFGWFGDSVSGAGDVNGDGFDDVIVGATWNSPAGRTRAGAAFIYSGATGAFLRRFDGQESYAYLGNSVSGVGDVDGDGLDDVIAGAHGADPGGRDDAGTALIYATDPLDAFLSLDTNRLSASAGGRVNFFLDFPDSESGVPYVLLASLTGTGPWFVPGGCVPLTFDALTQRMTHTPPPVFHNTAGTLGAGGTAQAWLIVAPGGLSGYVGARLWFAAVAYVPASGLHYSSVALPLDILP